MHNVCRTATGDLYISDTRNNLVRKVDGKTGETTIVAGTRKAGFNGDGVPAVSAQLNINFISLVRMTSGYGLRCPESSSAGD